MELWIRSQDRKKLINVDEVKIETVKEGNTFIYSHATDLGTYKTKERALEVLDEIQNALLNKWANNVKYEEHFDDESPRNLVYEMPLE